MKKEEEARELEILVHTSDSNLFGAIGHVDICYQGKVISYGSYDPFSERLFGTIGDGVLFKVDKNHTSNYVKRVKDAVWLQPIPYRRRESGSREASS